MIVAAVLSGAGLGEWILGAAVFPAVLVVWQKIRTTIDPEPIMQVGPLAHVVTAISFLMLYSTPSYAPALSVTSGAALIFFGASMLIAAVRGYRGCEVLALPNWLLGRNDQVGCVLYSPIDRLESRAGRGTA